MPKEDGNASFEDLEGLPEGLVDTLSAVLDKKFQSFADKQEAARKALQKELQQSNQRTEPTSTDPLDRIQHYVAQGTPFDVARQKVEEEQMKEDLRNLLKDPASVLMPQTSALDVTNLGFEANDQDARAIADGQGTDVEKAFKLFELKQKRASAGDGNDLNQPLNRSGGEEKPDETLMKQVQAYAEEMQECMALPSAQKKIAQMQVRDKWRNILGDKIDNVHMEFI